MFFRRRSLQNIVFLVIGLICLDSKVSAHGADPRGMVALDWRTEQISGVFSFLPINRPSHIRTETIEGRQCTTAPVFSVDVDDQYAHDIDELVTVEVEFYIRSTPKVIHLHYDKNADIAGVETAEITDKKTNRFHRHVFTLERARFSGRRLDWFAIKGDFSITTPERSFGKDITICNIVIKRSDEAPKATEYGRISLNVVDEFGRATPARVGLYNASGRMPLPDHSATPIKYYEDVSRSVSLPSDGRVAWPSNNRQVMYVNGNYQSKLPVGIYNIVIARGLEYAIQQESVVVDAGKETVVDIQLERWVNMIDKGWFSGDIHIHSNRNSTDDNKKMRLIAKAEDLNIANVLQMNNIGDFYFPQQDWGEPYGELPYSLMAGLEGPRTNILGHTIQLNIDRPMYYPERYFLYDEVFNETHKQGGLTGYAHSGNAFTRASECPGLALDLADELVDFIEVIQFGSENTKCWFSALNLGFKISPAGGTDFPYNEGILGGVRSYVNTGAPYSVQSWFDNLKAGKTFVTSGPMLSLTINGNDIGSDFTVDKGEQLVIQASASINPDIDFLDRIELIRQGDIIATEKAGSEATTLKINHQIKADGGGWFILRAQGKNKHIIALSAPIYIRTPDSGFCKPVAIPSLVKKLNQDMQSMLETSLENEFEPWDTYGLSSKYWSKNKALVQQRVNTAAKKYDHVLALSQVGRCVRASR